MKIRLYKADREVIAADLTAHKFDPIEAALAAQEYLLADEVYKRAYSEADRRWIDNSPKGALPTKGRLKVNAAGCRHVLRFGANPDAPRAIFEKHEYSYTLSLEAGDDLGERINAHAMACKEATTERDTTLHQVEATLAKFSTFDALLDAWPEAETFIKARMTNRPGLVSVPAVILTDLTAKLDLPPEDQAAA